MSTLVALVRYALVGRAHNDELTRAMHSVCVECILYGPFLRSTVCPLLIRIRAGVALAQFILSLYLLATRRRSGSKGPASTRPPVSWIFAPLILLFTICSAHLGVGIVKFHSYALTPSPALEGAKIALYTIAVRPCLGSTSKLLISIPRTRSQTA